MQSGPIKLGIVFPHDEIGVDPIAIRDYVRRGYASAREHAHAKKILRDLRGP